MLCTEAKWPFSGRGDTLHLLLGSLSACGLRFGRTTCKIPTAVAVVLLWGLLLLAQFALFPMTLWLIGVASFLCVLYN